MKLENDVEALEAELESAKTEIIKVKDEKVEL